jgi:hypothetical protein
MRSLSAPELLRAWERGLNQPLLQRALELLSLAYPQASSGSLHRLAIGKRDAELLSLRERIFGPEMICVAVCPECGLQLDLALDTTEIQAAGAAEPDTRLALSMDGYELQFRQPSSEDLAAALDPDDPAGSEARLLGLCVLSAEREGEPVSSDELPDEVAAAISERMASADPLADIQLAVSCPSCSHQWRATFDIVSFLWREVECLATRLLREVHALASGYGWSENDILTLSPARRQFYLDMVEA